MLLGHRYYDSSTGRFLTRDKRKDGRNWYVYAKSTPTVASDPTGLSSTFNPHAKLLWIRLLIEEAKSAGIT
jgi:hypothetical protein